MSKHEWVDYVGLTEAFTYCSNCDSKKDGSEGYNCAGVESTWVNFNPVWMYEEGVKKEYPYYFNSVTAWVSPDRCQSSNFNFDRYYTFSEGDDLTILEFEDGTRSTPASLYPSGYMYRSKFRFVKIREQWRGDYGLEADEYIQDVPANSPTTNATTGAGPNNQNAGNTNGSKHGLKPGAGLGTVAHTLEERSELLTTLLHQGIITRGMYEKALLGNDDR